MSADLAKPILLLDVDGVLNAVCNAYPTTWPTWTRTKANGFTITWSPEMIAALVQLADRVEMRWLTTWWADTEHLAFLGLPPMEVANTQAEYLARRGLLDWWKLAVAQRVYGEGRRVIWIDDDLRFDKGALAWGRSLPKGTLIGVSPATDTGLTPAQIEQIERWIPDELPPAEDVQP